MASKQAGSGLRRVWARLVRAIDRTLDDLGTPIESCIESYGSPCDDEYWLYW